MPSSLVVWIKDTDKREGKVSGISALHIPLLNKKVKILPPTPCIFNCPK